MAKAYTKEDLFKGKRIYANLLSTKTLQEFYIEYLISNVYIYELNNGEHIKLIFTEDQFCHLVGLSYFSYKGISGWNNLLSKSILISNLPNIKSHLREEIRLTNFGKIIQVLNDPTVYLYKNNDMNYQSDYFAVWNDGTRYYKLGIGTMQNGINYGETYQVSLMNSKDNKEIDSKNILTVAKKEVKTKIEYFDN